MQSSAITKSFPLEAKSLEDNKDIAQTARVQRPLDSYHFWEGKTWDCTIKEITNADHLQCHQANGIPDPNVRLKSQIKIVTMTIMAIITIGVAEVVILWLIMIIFRK